MNREIGPFQCDSCKFYEMNFDGKPKNCPNFPFFFKTFMRVYDDPPATKQEGVCDKWEKKEDSE